MSLAGARGSLWPTFRKGVAAGLSAVLVGFLLRLGGVAPFPPEAAFQAFVSVVPAAIEEPAVQSLGDLAGYLGIIVASAIAVCVYGFFAVVFERVVARRLGRTSFLTAQERLIVYALVPWLFFGLVVLPLAGDSYFGVASPFASPGTVWVLPLTLLLVQCVYSVSLHSEYRNDKVRGVQPSAPLEAGQPPMVTAPVRSRSVSRREFLEKGTIWGATAGLLLFSAVEALPLLGSLTTSGILPGTPINSQQAPPIFDDPRLAQLLDSEVTSNDAFYRVAIDILDPSVDAAGWTLHVKGIGSASKRYSLADLKQLPQAVRYSTLECVSNVLNGNLISNAKWTGATIAAVLNDAGVSQPSGYVIFRSVDGYSVGIPMERAMRSDSLLAFNMNDLPLPAKHGFPLRAVIPGLYGMMSAKWVSDIEVVDSVFNGYWQTRGWSNDATVQTGAFILLPGDGSSASASQNGGSVMLGGVAYAGDRGISKVEVSVDGGRSWVGATVKPPISNDTWALWALDWHPAQMGSYTIMARATDGTGSVQTATVTDTFPNGATGYAGINVDVVQ